MSIGSYNPAAYASAAPTQNTSQYAAASAPTANTGSTMTAQDTYSSGTGTATSGTSTSGPYGQDVPVQDPYKTPSKFGMVAGAAAAGGAAFFFRTAIFRFLPFIKNPTTLAIAGVVGVAALIGGFFGKKLTGG